MSTIDCVVAAHNEESTIGEVLRVLRASGVFRHIIVVDDGSKDATGAIAVQAGAHVLRLDPNGGKGAAMLAGVRFADSVESTVITRGRERVRNYAPLADAFAFFDADLTGLQPEHVRLLADHFALGFDMVCGLRDAEQGPSVAGIRYPNSLQIFMPLLTGERFLKRWVVEKLHHSCWDGYSPETALNFVVDKHGGKTCLVLMKGVIGKQKQAKVGFLKGWAGQFRMYRQIRETRAALESSNGMSCRLPKG